MPMNGAYGTPEERYKKLSAIYDDLFPYDEEGAATVAFLAQLAPGGRVLELGVGTGRIAIPLAASGCEVTGVDASPDMLRVLRAKDHDRKVRALHLDMAALGSLGEFDLIYSVYNSLHELHTQEQQVSCLKSAARLLRCGGNLLIEAAVPNRMLAAAQPISTGPFTELDTAIFQVMHYDQASQIVQYRHVSIAADGIKVTASTHRMIYLPELDLMAALAGLKLTTRYADWAGRSFDASCGRHISVYHKHSQE